MPGSLSRFMPVEPAAGVAERATWPVHVLLGWCLAGIANVAAAVWSASAAVEPTPVGSLASHAVDLGRHVGIGFASASAVWVTRRWLPRARLGWLVFLVLSLALGAMILPTDLDDLAQRRSEQSGLPASLWVTAIVGLVAGAVPLLAWLTRQRSFGSGFGGSVLSLARPLGAAVLALLALAVNTTVSPGTNPSAHLYLSWLTAVCAGHMLPRLELAPGALVRVPAARGLLAALGFAALWGVWALFAPHSNSVMIQIARRPSSLHLAAVFHSEGRLDTVQAALAARAGPFFAERSGLAPTPPSPVARPPGPPIVIFLSIDSLRADVTRHPEHSRFLPNLVALMGQGASFTNARAPGSMTKYTIASVSMGKYFSQQYWTLKGKARWPHEDDSVHVATLLSQAGVFTAAFPSVRWFLERLGMVEGFMDNRIEGEPMSALEKTWIKGSSLTQRLVDTLEREAARPGYYWLHYLDSHDPFLAGGRSGTKFNRYLRALRVVDGHVGEVRAAIQRLGLESRVLLIVTSDHGEAFGEHGSKFHGDTLYDELVRVPLVFVGPGVVAREVDAAVSLIDLGPTLLDWFGVDTPASFMGESLVPLLLGQSREFSRPIVAETGLKQSMLFPSGRKVIRDLRRQTLEMYDLAQDPGELHNLSDDIDPDNDEHVLLLRSFFQSHTYRRDGYRVPYVK
jgi:hypothetical protein